MKKHIQLTTFFRNSIVLAMVLLLGLTALPVPAQEDTGQEEVEQLRTRMRLSAIQGDEGNITVKALVLARVDGRYTGIPGLEVAFHSATDSLQKELGTDSTDENGIASLSIPKSELYRDTADAFLIQAVFDGNDGYRGSDDETTVVAAGMTIETTDDDSIKTLQITLMSRGQPVADATVGIFVESLFNPLKVGSATTDEEGSATIGFPTDLPGDEKGNLNIFARLDDHELYGSVETHVTKAWGNPVTVSDELPRALWSSSPPLWLLITFITLLVIIWGHYLEVIYKLVQVRKKAAES